jgi:hypothetical protein
MQTQCIFNLFFRIAMLLTKNCIITRSCFCVFECDCGFFGVGFVIRWLLNNHSEGIVIVGSLITSAVGFALFAFALHPFVLAASLLLIVAGSMTNPAVISIVSNEASESVQGAVIGAFASIEVQCNNLASSSNYIVSGLAF